MSRDIIIRIKSNPNFLKYLRENSYWYKELNRNPNAFKQFEEEVKKAYKLRPLDKIEKINDTIDFMSKLMSAFH